MQGALTSDYVINNVLTKNRQSKVLVEEDKSIEKELSYGQEDNSFLKLIEDDTKWLSAKEVKNIHSPIDMQLTSTPSKFARSKTIKEQKYYLDEVSRILRKKKITGFLPVKDHNIFPLSMRSKSKFLEAKDYIEIAIRYVLLEDQDIVNLIVEVFYEEFNICCCNIFPIFLYKLLVYYERLSLFEALYEKEKEHDLTKECHIINDCFAYAVMINNITVALYLLKKYKIQVHNKSELIVSSILHLLNEYTENNGAVRYHHGISHFEEIFYFLEIFIEGFTYTSCNYYLRIMFSLVWMKTLDEEECDIKVKDKVQRGYKVNQLRNNFIVYSPNPLKACLLVMDLTLKLKRMFPNLDKGFDYGITKYIKLFGLICMSWGDLDKINRCLQDTTYSGRMVYDLIASNELYELLNVSKASLIVSSMWDGKYETHSFLNYSLNYQIVKSIIFKQKNLIGYSPDYVDEMSISETYKKLKKKFNTRKERKYVKPVKAHFFMFKAWKKSMSIRYVIDAVFIIIVGIVLQVQMNTLQETASNWYVIYPVYWERHTRLQNSSLTVTEKAEAQILFIEAENEYLRIGNKAYGELMGIYVTMAIMMAYSFRNICQIIYAKLRKRTWESIYGEFALSI